MSRQQAIKEFFDVILKGESKTYNDHNWYICQGSVKKCLRGYIEGRGKSPYPKLKKTLSSYTIQEVINFQKKARSGDGQLFATGRYQIIPTTLLGVIKDTAISVNEKYNQVNQDKFAFQLLLNSSLIKPYINATNEDNKTNLEKASLGVAKIWSSVGVPYAIQGKKQWVVKNQSYYTGGGDKASEKTEDVQIALKKLRKNISGKSSSDDNDDTNNEIEKKKYFKYFIIGGSLIAIATGITYYFLIYKKK